MDDIAEQLRHKQLVADRVAGQRSDIRAPHCWYCGKVEPWFTCDCAKARAAQRARDEGRRADYPRWNTATGCIENLDAETIAFNEALGFRVRPPANKPVSVDSVDSVDSKPAPPVDSVDTPDESVDRLTARRAYKAEHERQRRAKQKEDLP